MRTLNPLPAPVAPDLLTLQKDAEPLTIGHFLHTGEQHGKAWVLPGYLAGCFDTILHGHPEIEYREIGHDLRHLFNRIDSVYGFSAHSPFGLHFQQPSK